MSVSPQLTLLVVALLAVVVLAFLLWKRSYTRRVREQTLQRSVAVTTGKVSEQLVPYLADFPFNPRDARFLGSPVDFVVFDGLSDGEVKRIVFVEVKTGAAGLTTRERRVRDAVQARLVAWTELRLPRTPDPDAP
jgi:predicted Holliday junction resolvase-like endonuclease